jgi:tight adherence protein B
MNYVALNLQRLAILKLGGLVLVFTGIFLTVFSMVSNPEGIAYRYWTRYVVFLERKLRLMFVWTPGRSIALGQCAAIFGVIGLSVLVGLPFWYGFVALIAVGPAFYIEHLRQKRVTQIEEQLDSFLMALANALKATPSLGDAFISAQRLLPPPMKQEIELAVKEMRLGSTLEQALLFMASRIGSRQVDSALSAVLIGRQIGGNLPKILETTAASLREMARLEGVVRTKTAEGRAQLWVLAVFPVAIAFGLNSVREGYFTPLTESVIGYLLIAIAVIFWVLSLVVARKILTVDL